MRRLAPLAMLLATACSSADISYFDDLGAMQRPITTRSVAAQRWFDQGLVLTYAFHHEEAIRAYEAATRADPHCAIAWWGIAYAHGPNINAPMSPAQAEAAYAALQQALALREQASPVERDLIDALAKRYAFPPPADRAALDQAYADAMRAVHHRHRDDPDVAVLFAESLLDLRPWDQWTRDGRPQPGTEEAVAALEAALERRPDHPGALHLWIHALEASPEPDRALFAADRLRALVPDSGHLVHMPAHVYVRVGQYADAVSANARAIAVDRRYFARAGHGRFYDFYFAHNLHFLAYAAMLDGRFELAREAARAIELEVEPPDEPGVSALLDGLLATELHVLLRFGRYDAVLEVPEPPAEYPIWRAFWRYARALSFAASDRLDDAVREREAFVAARDALPPGASIVLTPAADVMAVATRMLDGELAFRQGRQDEAFAALREAVGREEQLRYDEPPGWMMPVRHALGALLLEAGRAADAEAVYRADLASHPENGWSLHGLAECLVARGASDEAAAVGARFAQAWARADVELHGSCFCRRRD